MYFEAYILLVTSSLIYIEFH